MARGTAPRNRDLLLPYLLPYVAYMGVATLLPGPDQRAMSYALRIAACGAALVWGWRRYLPLRGPGSTAGSVGMGLGVGLLGTALWIALLTPFAAPAGSGWDPTAFALRVVAGCALVPLAEELLMRGYLLAVLVQWQRARRAGEADPLRHTLASRSIAELEPGDWTWLALLLSSLVFAAGHAPAEWPAALAYGLLMGGLWIVRRDLLSCVIAHAATNATLAFTVLATGRWELW